MRGILGERGGGEEVGGRWGEVRWTGREVGRRLEGLCVEFHNIILDVRQTRKEGFLWVAYDTPSSFAFPHPPSHTHTHTHSRIHTHTHSLTHSLTHRRYERGSPQEHHQRPEQNRLSSMTGAIVMVTVMAMANRVSCELTAKTFPFVEYVV